MSRSVQTRRHQGLSGRSLVVERTSSRALTGDSAASGLQVVSRVYRSSVWRRRQTLAGTLPVLSQTRVIVDAAAHVAVGNQPQELMRRVAGGTSPWQQGCPHAGHVTDVSEAGVNRVTHSKTKICLQPDPEVLMSSGVLLL